MSKRSREEETYGKLIGTISDAQGIRYLQLLASSYYIARHDISGNALAAALGQASLLEKQLGVLLSRLKETAHSSDVALLAEEIRGRLQVFQKCTGILNSAFRSYFDIHVGSGGVPDEGLLLASPWSVFSALRKSYPDAAIKVRPPAARTLVIPFPGPTLYGVLAELVKNAIRHAGGESEVHLSWHTSGEGFVLSVDDGGQTAGRNLPDSFIPFNELERALQTSKSRGGGLDMISRLIALAGGSVLFSRSRTLGGMLARVQIPISAYILRGRIVRAG